MLKALASSITPDTIRAVRTSPNHAVTRTMIHICARVAQIVFASGCFFTALQIPYRIFQIVTGGFILIQGPQMLFQIFPIIAYYDLAQISSNIASIFKSTVLIQFAKDQADNVPYGTQIAQVLEDYEEKFSLPRPIVKKIKGAESIAAAITHETIVAHNLNGVLTALLT